ncbi:MAG: toxin FitB, partial [Kribbellaceae bacterium]|nr:toxin FitB [Kribbellaceae bacterium]
GRRPVVIVLDTDVLSEPLRQDPDVRVLTWLEHAADGAAITVVSVSELLYGAQRLPAGRRRNQLLVSIEQMLAVAGSRLLSYDESSARIHASLRVTREAVGQPISVEDGMIAAICLGHEARLATRNIKDFTGLGIDVVNPWA